jgi:alkylation response protein AidB-like acyl-CoA dehydrogenase
VVEVARRIADDVLFPAAVETDASGVVPAALLDQLADAGLYGLTGPVTAGGLGADAPTTWAVAEALASGCRSVTFVWMQHIGVVRAAAASDNPAIRDYVAPLCAGTLRAGVALAGALAGRPSLRAAPAENGWTFSGNAPFVSGWDRIDLLHAAAATDDGRLVWGMIEAHESESLSAHRLDLAALDASSTVSLEFRDQPVPPAQITAITPGQTGQTAPEVLRVHACLALGLTARCCRLLGPTALDAELDEVRAELDRLSPDTIEAARGAAGELAVRAAAALAVTTGSRSLLRANPAQLLLRDALFVLVYALRPGSRLEALARLGTG